MLSQDLKECANGFGTAAVRECERERDRRKEGTFLANRRPTNTNISIASINFNQFYADYDHFSSNYFICYDAADMVWLVLMLSLYFNLLWLFTWLSYTHTHLPTLTHLHSIDSIWYWSQLNKKRRTTNFVHYVHSVTLRTVLYVWPIVTLFLYHNSIHTHIHIDTRSPEDLETTCAEFE